MENNDYQSTMINLTKKLFIASIIGLGLAAANLFLSAQKEVGPQEVKLERTR